MLRDSGQYGARRPDRITSNRYRRDLDEVKALGGDGVTTPSARTGDQAEIALFWVADSPLSWNRIARSLATAEGLDIWEAARLSALLDIAMADGSIDRSRPSTPTTSGDRSRRSSWPATTATPTPCRPHLDGTAHDAADPRSRLGRRRRGSWRSRCSGASSAPIASRSRPAA